jgi:hypothetical protein
VQGEAVVAIAVAVAAAVVAFTTFAASAMAAIAALVALEFVATAITAASVAAELVSAATATRVAVKLVRVTTPAVTALEIFTACFTTALATERVVTGERMPKRMQRRAIMSCEETFVRATRTGKTMLMTHLGHSHLCLKMCRKIYI